MTRSSRWTEDDLAKINGGNVLTGSISSQKNKSLVKNVKTNPPARIVRRDKTIQSIITTNISGEHERNEYFNVKFDGAMLLSSNSLYALTHYERISYRKAWHDIVNFAVAKITGGPRYFNTFLKFEIGVHVQTQRLCDTDAVSSQLKHLIDGLVRSGIVFDDNPNCFIRYSSIAQTKGSPFVSISIKNIKPD